MSLALVLAAGALAALVPVLLRRPELAVGLFAFVLLIHGNLVLSQRFGLGSADRVLAGAMLALLASYPLLHGDRFKGVTRFGLAICLWLAAVGNSLVWSSSAGVSIDPLREFLPNLVYATAMVLLITDARRLLYALGGVVAASVLLASLTIVQVVFGIESSDFYGFANGAIAHIAEDNDAIRPSGPLFDANYYAQVLMPGFGIAMAAAAGLAVPRLRIVAGSAAFAIALAILLTSSRGGLVAAMVVVLYALYRFRKAGLLVLVVPPVLLAMTLVPAYAERLQSVASSVAALVSGQGITEASIAGRIAEMEAAIILFSEHPVSGAGYGMFESRYQDISASHDLTLRSADRAAHSLYLETAAEQGLIGLAVLLTILGMGLWGLRRSRMMAEGEGEHTLAVMLTALGSGSIGLFLAAIFLHDAYAQHFWLMLGLLFASERVGLEWNRSRDTAKQT